MPELQHPHPAFVAPAPAAASDANTEPPVLDPPGGGAANVANPVLPQACDSAANSAPDGAAPAANGWCHC